MARRKQILIVEPDREASTEIVRGISERDLVVEARSTGAEALGYLAEATGEVDVLLTELLLPDMSGFGLIRALRDAPEAHQPAAVVVLSRLASEIDRILAFELGVDDYVAKPFLRRELAARLRAILRRAEAPVVHEPSSRQAQREVEFLVGAAPLRGTPRELQILSELYHEQGRVLSREEILVRVWGRNSARTLRCVDTHVKSLRRKLGIARGCIETVRGIGYRYAADAEIGLRLREPT